MKNYDVIIIGAGPAGLGSALNLAKKGIKVLVVEENKLGKTEKTWVTFLPVLKKYNLEENIVNRIGSLTFRSYLGGCYKLDGKFAAAVDEENVLKNLTRQAQSFGAEIHEFESFVNYRYSDDIIVVNTDKSAYGAILMVDAMGEQSTLLESFGFANPRVDMGCLAYEVEELKIKNQFITGSVGLKISVVATGRADFYYHPSGYAKEWDSCAPQAILEAAGGVMTDIFGNPLGYLTDDVFQREGFLAASPEVHKFILENTKAELDAG